MSWFDTVRPAQPVAQPTAQPVAPPDIRAMLAARGVNVPAPGSFFGKIVDASGSFAQQLPKDPKELAMMRLQAIQQAHPGGFFGKIAGAVTSPAVMQALQQRAGQQQPQGFGQGIVPATEALMAQRQAPPPAVMQALSNGSTMVPPTPQRMVKMRAPDGTEEDVPEQDVEHYKQQGATMSGY